MTIVTVLVTPVWTYFDPQFNTLFADIFTFKNFEDDEENKYEIERIIDLEHSRFLTGLLEYFTAQFNFRAPQLGLTLNVTDDRPGLDLEDLSVIHDGIFKGVKLHDYQVAAIKTMLMRKRGIVRIPTRGGKTEVALGGLKIAMERGDVTKALIIQNTNTLVDQVADRMVKRGFAKSEVGKFTGSSKQLNRPIVAATIQSLYSGVKNGNGELLEFLRTVDYVFIDECHHASAYSEYMVLVQCAEAKYLVAVSGTPFNDRLDEFSNFADVLTVGLTGGIIYEITPQYLISRGIIANPFAVFIRPLPVRTNRFISSYHQAYKTFIVKNKNRNGVAIDMAQFLYENGLRVLLLVTQKDHGKDLCQQIASFAGTDVRYIEGGSSYLYCVGGKMQPVATQYGFQDDFNSGKFRILIATQVADEGLDLPSLDSVILLGGGKSYIKSVQRPARALCPNNWDNKVYIVDFWDDSHRYLKRHSQERMDIYQSVCYNIVADLDEFKNMVIESGKLRELYPDR